MWRIESSYDGTAWTVFKTGMRHDEAMMLATTTRGAGGFFEQRIRLVEDDGRIEELQPGT